MVWCCKTNFKTNPSRLETKKEEPYTHTFKCVNYKGNHHADMTALSRNIDSTESGI